MSNFRLADELIDRTEKNLRAIEELANQGQDVYEVTQLINSLLALLVYPYERLHKHIQSINRAMMVNEHWPLPYEEISTFTNLGQLIRYMRNAVAHFNIELKHDDTEIVAIRFENYRQDDSERKEPNWAGEYDLDSLRSFVYMLLDHLKKDVIPGGNF